MSPERITRVTVACADFCELVQAISLHETYFVVPLIMVIVL
jgi:hypothetical protein